MINNATNHRLEIGARAIPATLVRKSEVWPADWQCVKSAFNWIPNTFLVFSPLCFFLTAMALETLYPDFNRVQSTISELVWGPGGWVMTATFVLFGFAVMATALKLSNHSLRINTSLKIGLTLLFLIGLGFVILGIFPTKAPGAGQSIKVLLHQTTANSLTIGFPLSCFFLAGGLWNKPELQAVRLYSWITALVGLAMVPAGAAALLSQAPWLGAIERVMAGNGLLWLQIVTITLLLPQQSSLTQITSWLKKLRSPLEKGSMRT